MKVVLVVPPQLSYIESYVSERLDKDREARPRLGLLSVAGQLRKDLEITPIIIDCLAENINVDNLVYQIKQLQPDIVGFSVLTFNLLDSLEMSLKIKAVSPNTKICFGGHHPTLYPRETLSFPQVDYIVAGEGELTFVELVQALDGNRSLTAIKGLGYKDTNHHPIINEPRALCENLDDLAFPAYDLIDLSKYTYAGANSAKSAAIQTTRGCYGSCIFCDIRKTKVRFRSPESIIEEIKWLKRLGVKEFFFIDDNFNISKKRTLELCKLIIENGLNISYKVSSRVDLVDEDIMEALKASGCHSIYFGVESGSQDMLDVLNKGITISKIKKAFSLSKQYGMKTFAYAMVGIPGETKDDMQKTFELIRKLRPNYVNYAICLPLPKTELTRKAIEDGTLMEDIWQEFAENPHPITIPTINETYTSTELRNIQEKAMRNFYISPRVVLNELKKINDTKQLMVKAGSAVRLLRPKRTNN